LPSSIRLVNAHADCDSSWFGDPHWDGGIRRVSHRPFNVLVLSGGGMYGAYPAGVLRGWTESGSRPQFDIVTGVSTGALIAPYAFLGEEHDDELEHSYTAVESSDVYKRRPLTTLLWSDSLAYSDPLWGRIVDQVTPEFLEKIARAHREGRRLYVGTTNIDTKRPVVWDMGAIAAGDHPDKLDLFRKVLLASSSFPGFLPPVAINVQIDGQLYTELHVDGGVGASLFLHPHMLGECYCGLPSADSCKGNVYVIVAGKLYPDPTPVTRGLFQISEGSLDGVLQSQLEGDLFRVFLLSRYSGMQFSLTAVPQDFAQGTSSMTFDPKFMRELFELGRQFGVDRGPWRAVPPGVDPREWQQPRTGIQLSSEHVCPLPAGLRLPRRGWRDGVFSLGGFLDQFTPGRPEY
jgi:hypothetical protein